MEQTHNKSCSDNLIKILDYLKDLMIEYSIDENKELNQSKLEIEKKLEQKEIYGKKKIIEKLTQKIDIINQIEQTINDLNNNYNMNIQNLEDINIIKQNIINQDSKSNLKQFDFENIKDFEEYKNQIINDCDKSNQLENINQVIDIFELYECDSVICLNERLKDKIDKIESLKKTNTSEKIIRKRQDSINDIQFALNVVSDLKQNLNKSQDSNILYFNNIEHVVNSNYKIFIDSLMDGINLPSCAEKYFNLLVSYLQFNYDINSIDKLKNKINIEDNIIFDEIEKYKNEDYMSKILEQLEKYLKVEGSFENKEIKSLFNELDKCYRSGNYEAFKKSIESCLKSYRSLNIQDLKRLILSINNVASKIQGKEIILLLGDTGSGKSTTIQFLLKMKMLKNSVNGISHIEGDFEQFMKKNRNQSEEFLDSIKNLKSSCLMKSETRHINAIELNLREYGKNNGTIVLCDTPGFKDSSGSEVDIANGIAIIRAIHEAENVRPIILLSSKGIGDRGTELKKYARTITSLISDINSLKNKIFFLFTKFQNESIEDLNSIFKNVKDNLSIKESVSRSYEQFFEILVKSSKKSSGNSKILNVLKDDPEELLSDIIDRDPIEMPKNYFNNFITEESKNDIIIQIKNHSKVIKNCLEEGYYEIVNFKLEELKFIEEEIKICNNPFEENIKIVKNQMKKKFDAIKREIELIISKEKINSDDIMNITNSFDIIKNSKILQNLIGADDLPNTNNLETFILQCLENENIDNLELGSSKLLNHLIKYKILRVNYEFVQNKYDEVIEILKDKFNISLNKLNESIDLIENKNHLEEEIDQKNIFETFLGDILKFEKNKINYIEYIDNNNYIEEIMNKFKNILLDKYNQCKSKIDSIENKQSNTINDVKYINNYLKEISIILSIKTIIELPKYNLVKDLEEFYSSILNIIKDKFDTYEKNSIEYIMKNDLDNFEMSGNEVKKMEILKNIDKVSKDLIPRFHNNIDKISNFLKSMLKYVKESIDETFYNNGSNNFDIKKSSKFLTSIHKCQWIKDYKEVEFDYFKTEIENSINIHLDKDISNIDSSEINLDDFSEFQLQFKSYNRLNIIQNIITEYNNLDQIIHNSIKKFKESFGNIILNIESIIQRIEKYDIKIENDKTNYIHEVYNNMFKLEQSYNFLLECKKLKYTNETNNCLNRLLEIIENFKLLNIEYINEIFRKIHNIILNYEIDEDNNYNHKLNEYKTLINEIQLINSKIKKTEKKCEIMFKLIDQDNELINIIKNNIHKISATFKNQINKHEEENEISKMKIKIVLLHESYVFDDIIYDDINNHNNKNTFEKILNDLKKFLKEEIPKFENEMEYFINNNDYDSLEKLMINMIDSKDPISKKLFDKMKNRFNNYLEGNIRNVLNLSQDYISKDLKLEDVKLLSETMQKVIKMMKFKKELFNNFENFESFYNDCKKFIIESFDKELDKISSLNKHLTLNFNLEETISYLNKMKTYLKPCFEDFKDLTTVFKKLDKIEETLNDNFEKEISDIENKCIKDLEIEKLERLIHKLEKGSLYCLSSLKDKVFSHLKSKINSELKLLESTYDENKFKEYKRNIEIILGVFKESDIKYYSNSIDSSKEKFNLKLKDEAELFQEGMNNCDYKLLYELINNIKTRSDFPINKNKDLVRNFFREKLNEFIKRIEQYIKDNEINLAIDYLFSQVYKIALLLKYYPNEREQFKQLKYMLQNILKTIKQDKDELNLINEDFNNKNKKHPINCLILKLEELIPNNYEKFEISSDIMKEIEDNKEKLKIFTKKIISILHILNNNKDNKNETKENNESYEDFNEDIQSINELSEEIKKSCIDLLVIYLNILNDTFNQYQITESKYNFKQMYLNLLLLYILDENVNFNKDYNIIKHFIKDSEINFEDLSNEYTDYTEICNKTNKLFNEINNYFVNLKDEDIDEYYILNNNIKKKYLHFKGLELLTTLPKFPKNKNFSINKINSLLGDYLSKIQDKLLKNLELLNNFSIQNDIDYIFNATSFYIQLIDDNINEVKVNLLLTQFEKSQNSIYDKIVDDLKKTSKNKDIDDIASKIILLKIIGMNYKRKIDHFNNSLNGVLNELKKQIGNLVISKLAFCLDLHYIGRLIIQDFSIFEGYKIQLFNSKTKNHDITYVMNNIEFESKINEKEIDLIKESYKKFDKKQNELLNKFLNPQDNSLDCLITEIKDEFSKARKTLKGKFEIKSIKNNIPSLIAYIFSLWTLNNATYFFEANDNEDKDSYLLKAHPAQIIAIFRILKMGDYDDLENHLVQVKTGEGKSVILGVISTFFALLDVNVYVACYSEYLSERDYKYFYNIFESLHVKDKIQYGTFNKLCESVLKRKYNFRKKIKNFLLGNNMKEPNKAHKEKNILLIDEVDTFFSKDFQGNTYCPSIKFEDLIISNLIDEIWNYRDILNSLNFDRLKMSNFYIEFTNKFPTLVNLINNCIASMIFDLKNYKNHEYILKDNKIGYKEHDNIVFNINYGYKTMFAYYKESIQKRISADILKEKKYLIIKCGNFAYAEIPKYFDYILGVTGTLKALNENENKMIRDEYKILKKTYLPSVYGSSQLRFDKRSNFLVVANSDYYKIISDSIERGLCGVLKGTKRAVLIFFEDKNILNDFYNSHYFINMKKDAKILTEELDNIDKERIIKFSTISGSITLITKVFGRGTDFISNDESVINQGGIHVIQTFFSENISEEIQIQGRTARQGQIGTYEMILCENHLEKFGHKFINNQNFNLLNNCNINNKIQNNSLDSNDNYENTIQLDYNKLNSLRNEFCFKQYRLNENFIKESKKYHDLAIEFIKNLDDKVSTLKFLEQNNHTICLENIFSKSRTIILLDATNSMSYLLDNCKILIEKMFDRINSIITEKKINDGFEIQIGVYRNYNVNENLIFEYSPWEANPHNLRTFIHSVKVDGGLGPEAIEIALNHAYEENLKQKISQVILIGDAPSNSKNDVINKRRDNFGDEYWGKSKYRKIIDFNEECYKLSISNIPIHTFYLDDYAKNNFNLISNITKGKSYKMSLNSNDIHKDSEMLTEMVSTNILSNIGKISNFDSDELIKEYHMRYSKSYNKN